MQDSFWKGCQSFTVFLPCSNPKHTLRRQFKVSSSHEKHVIRLEKETGASGASSMFPWRREARNLDSACLVPVLILAGLACWQFAAPFSTIHALEKNGALGNLAKKTWPEFIFITMEERSLEAIRQEDRSRFWMNRNEPVRRSAAVKNGQARG